MAMKHGHLKQTVLNLVHEHKTNKFVRCTIAILVGPQEPLVTTFQVMSLKTYRRRSFKGYVEGGRRRRNQRKNCGEREEVNMSANEKPPYEGTRPVLSSPSRRQVPRADRLVSGPAGAS